MSSKYKRQPVESSFLPLHNSGFQLNIVKNRAIVITRTLNQTRRTQLTNQNSKQMHVGLIELAQTRENACKPLTIGFGFTSD